MYVGNKRMDQLKLAEKKVKHINVPDSTLSINLIKLRRSTTKLVGSFVIKVSGDVIMSLGRPAFLRKLADE